MGGGELRGDRRAIRWSFEKGRRPALSFFEAGRGDRIRTCDPHTPSVMRYQAALRPDRARGFLWNVWQHPAPRNLLMAAYMAVH